MLGGKSFVALAEGSRMRCGRYTYASHNNELRTHRSLTKDSLLYHLIERLGTVTSRPILGGFHHRDWVNPVS